MGEVPLIKLFQVFLKTEVTFPPVTALDGLGQSLSALQTRTILQAVTGLMREGKVARWEEGAVIAGIHFTEQALHAWCWCNRIQGANQ